MNSSSVECFIIARRHTEMPRCGRVLVVKSLRPYPHPQKFLLGPAALSSRPGRSRWSGLALVTVATKSICTTVDQCAWRWVLDCSVVLEMHTL